MITTIAFVYGFGAAASYFCFRAITRGHFERKYNFLYENDPNFNREFSLFFPILPAAIWPVGWPLMYYLSERMRYGLKWK